MVSALQPIISQYIPSVYCED